MEVTRSMVREAERVAEGYVADGAHPHDAILEAADEVARRRFPAAPDWERSGVAEEIADRTRAIDPGSADPDITGGL